MGPIIGPEVGPATGVLPGVGLELGQVQVQLWVLKLGVSLELGQVWCLEVGLELS